MLTPIQINPMGDCEDLHWPIGAADDVVSPTFRTYAVRKNKDELELLQARQKVRELSGSSAVTTSDDGAGDGVNDAKSRVIGRSLLKPVV